MQNSIRLLSASRAITLIILFFLGCTQNRLDQYSDVQSVECRSCHKPGGAAGAVDLTSIYTNPKSHHSVGVQYPLVSNAASDFNLPNGQVAGVSFFDGNGNGKPDGNEIQLFGAKGAFKVECSSCHKEHGDSRLSEKNVSESNYLRVNNVNSALCVACHNN